MTLLDPRTLLRPLAIGSLGVGARALLTNSDATVVACDADLVGEAAAELADGADGPVVLVACWAGAAVGPDADVLAVADRSDPLVFRTTVDGEGRGPLTGLAFRFHDVVVLPAGVVAGGTVLATVDGRPVVVERRTGRGHRLVVVGSASVLDDRWLAVAANAALADAVVGGSRGRAAVALVRALRPAEGPVVHPAPPVIDATGDAEAWTAFVAAVPTDAAVDSPEFLRAVARAGRLLPAAVHDALVEFADHGHPSGALVVRGLPVGSLPATPPSPRTPSGKDHVSEFALLAAGRRIGQPVGYRPEHGGELVQNLVPTAGAAGAQTSTSSSVLLEFHTEAAFHPHKPRFLLLLGLRADPSGEARTLLCSIDAVVDHLSLGARAVLTQARFRTSADESYTGGRTGRLGRLVPVLGGDPARPSLTFDADLMSGVDAEATAALEELRALVREHAIGVALGAGDLLVVDNHRAVHGRTPFRARYDGTDRWLQRSFVVTDLEASAGERTGRCIDTRFVP